MYCLNSRMNYKKVFKVFYSKSFATATLRTAKLIIRQPAVLSEYEYPVYFGDGRIIPHLLIIFLFLTKENLFLIDHLYACSHSIIFIALTYFLFSLKEVTIPK